MVDVNAPYAGLLRPSSTPEMDPSLAYIAKIPRMAEQSLFAQQEVATSYRQFNVGSTLLVYNEALGDYMMLTHGNWKFRPESKKHCAEMFALDEMDALNQDLRNFGGEEQVGTFKPVGLVTVATSDKDKIFDVTHKRTPTLHMCADCVAYYDAHPLVEDSLLNMTMPDTLAYAEVFSLRDYKEGAASKGLARVIRWSDWQYQADVYRALKEDVVPDSGLDVTNGLARTAILGAQNTAMPDENGFVSMYRGRPLLSLVG